MILDKIVKVQLNPRNVKHYEEKGYEIPYVIKNKKKTVPRGTYIDVDVTDLPDGAHVMVNVMCDNPNCNKCNQMQYRYYKEIVDKYGNYLCFSCSHEHQKQTLQQKYGVDNISQIDGVAQKKKETLIRHYGIDNPMKSSEIREKTRATNLRRYGTEAPAQNEQIKEKAKATLFERYGVTSTYYIAGVKEKIERTNFEKYGTPYAFQNKEIYKKYEETMLERYGSKNVMNSPELAEKQRQSCFDHYGVYYPSQCDEINQKIRQTLFSYGTAPVSNQQLYIQRLLKGELNYPLYSYSLDIFIKNDKTVIEYDGSGHDLSVKIGRYSKEQFEKNEMIRNLYIKREGFNLIKIICPNDLIPSDEVLLYMYDFAQQYFNSTDHTWVEFYPEKNMIRNADHNDSKGYFFDFGELRKIRKSDIQSQEVNNVA